MDNRDYTSSFLDVLTMNCMKETREDPKTYETPSPSPSNDEGQAQAGGQGQMQKQIAQMQCLSSCSKTGSCVEGECVCLQGKGQEGCRACVEGRMFCTQVN